MALLHVEKLGGLAGFGGPAARIRSLGHLETDTLLPEEQRILDDLFNSPAVANAAICDAFRYRLSRTLTGKSESIEVPEDALPASVIQCVKDELV